MTRRIDIATWKRRDHYLHFRDFSDPFFNICTDVDVSRLVQRVRESSDISFTAGVLWASLRAVNEMEEFRYRLDSEGVVIHDVIHAGWTVLRDDGTFCFAYADFSEDLEAFVAAARLASEQVRSTIGGLGERDGDDLVWYSIIPWV